VHIHTEEEKRNFSHRRKVGERFGINKKYRLKVCDSEKKKQKEEISRGEYLNSVRSLFNWERKVCRLRIGEWS